MKHQLQSFKCAARGIIFAIKHESHMRFHLVAAVYVAVFSLFYGFSSSQVAILALLISSVIAAEVFNTSLEELCNLDTDSYNLLAKNAKDLAAGAVLVLSVAAAVIGFIFFFDLEIIRGIIAFFAVNPLLLFALVLSVILSVIFIALGPVGLTDIFYKHRKK